MSGTMTVTETSLPDGFSDLEHLVAEWAFPLERERYAKRVASSMEEIQAFYDEIYPRARAAMDHLDQFDLSTMPADAQRLMWLLYSLCAIGHCVEVWGQPKVPDSGAAYVARVKEGPA